MSDWSKPTALVNGKPVDFVLDIEWSEDPISLRVAARGDTGQGAGVWMTDGFQVVGSAELLPAMRRFARRVASLSYEGNRHERRRQAALARRGAA